MFFKRSSIWDKKSVSDIKEKLIPTSTLTFCLKSQILSGCDVSEGGGMWLQMSLHCFHCLGKQRV